MGIIGKTEHTSVAITVAPLGRTQASPHRPRRKRTEVLRRQHLFRTWQKMEAIMGNPMRPALLKPRMSKGTTAKMELMSEAITEANNQINIQGGQ
jgi:hypothetical protein